MSAFGDENAIAQKWIIESECAGMRADRYLVRKIGRLSRSKAKRIILAGDFRRDDGWLKPSHPMRLGESVELWRLPPEEDELDMGSVRVIFEDSDWLVVDKPAGLAVHPTARYLHHTLTGWLKRYAPDIPIHPCHRLDRETSGVMVCAKNRKAEANLKTAFQSSRVRKQYLAIVRGEFRTSQIIDAPLSLAGPSGLVKIRMNVGNKDGLPSKTKVSAVCYDALLNRSLVSCEPFTGRQHQIRAHLAHIGHPIVGDKLYAMGDDFFDAFTKRELGERILELEHPRQALHAYSIAFENGSDCVNFHAPLPFELKSLISHSVLSHLPPELDRLCEISQAKSVQVAEN